ncbi:MAG: CPBP family intramembrane glutamic endopeptidase [Candidatus Sericytochromatia bacterium]|nr:CPBP family intramembrane glutamic endopeptidase [Candidatus Sericytochromatia bacterium]
MSLDPHPTPETRLAGWYRQAAPGTRLGVWLAAVVAAWGGWAAALVVMGVPLAALWRPDTQRLFLGGAYGGLLGVTVLMWIRLQGLPIVVLTGRWCARAAAEAGAWFLLGVCTLLAVEGGLVVSGLARWRSPVLDPTALTLWFDVLGAAWLFSLSEEFVFRGFVLRTLAAGGRWWAAGLVSSLSYATVHFLRADVVWHAIALPWLGLFLAGGLLAWLAFRTQGMWASAGLHAGWLAVFLLLDRLRLLEPAPTAVLWTGGGYPLGGLAGLGAVLGLWGATAWAWRRRTV